MVHHAAGVIRHTSSSPAVLHATDNMSQLHHVLPSAGYAMSCLMIFKAIVGAGLFALPFAFKLMGWGAALLTMVAMGGLTFYTSILIVRVHHVVQRDSLEKHLTFVSIAQHTLGGVVGGFVYALMAFTTLGTIGSFLVFNGSVLHSLLPSVSILQWAAVVALCMQPFCLIRSSTFLSYSSLGGNIGVVIVMLAVFIGGAQVSHSDQLTPSQPFKMQTYLSALGIVGYLYSCSRSIITIEGAMKDRRTFASALLATMCVVFVVANAFGLANLAYFGEDVCSVIVINLGSGPASVIAKVAIVLDLAMSIPLQIAPLVEIMSKSFLTDATPHLHSKVAGLRTLTLMASFLFAFFPSFSLLVNLVGGMSAAALQFILPCMMLLQLRRTHLAGFAQQQTANATLSHDRQHHGITRSTSGVDKHAHRLLAAAPQYLDTSKLVPFGSTGPLSPSESVTSTNSQVPFVTPTPMPQDMFFQPGSANASGSSGHTSGAVTGGGEGDNVLLVHTPHTAAHTRTHGRGMEALLAHLPRGFPLWQVSTPTAHTLPSPTPSPTPTPTPTPTVSYAMADGAAAHWWQHSSVASSDAAASAPGATRMGATTAKNGVHAATSYSANNHTTTDPHGHTSVVSLVAINSHVVPVSRNTRAFTALDVMSELPSHLEQTSTGPSSVAITHTHVNEMHSDVILEGGSEEQTPTPTFHATNGSTTSTSAATTSAAGTGTAGAASHTLPPIHSTRQPATGTPTTDSTPQLHDSTPQLHDSMPQLHDSAALTAEAGWGHSHSSLLQHLAATWQQHTDTPLHRHPHTHSHHHTTTSSTSTHKHMHALQLLGIGSPGETVALYVVIVFGFAMWIVTTVLSLNAAVEGSSSEPALCTGG